MRNYEVGDLIKIGRVGWDIVRKINYEREMVYLKSGGFVFDTDITVIRKPRLGGKEARDIVAMLARNGNKEHNKLIRQMKGALSSYESDLESYDGVDNDYTEHDLRHLIERQKMRIKDMYKRKRVYGLLSDYRTAKAMLKEQS